MKEEQSLRLAGMAYDAALDEHKWPAFLEEFARAVDGSSSMMRSVDLQTGTAGFVASVGYDPAWQEAYCNHFVKVDYLTPALTQFRLGDVWTGDQIFSSSELRTTEFFNDYCAPQDKVHSLGTVLAKEGNYTLLFAAQRGRCAGVFGKKELRLMNILAPHVTRAVRVQRNLGSIAVNKEWAFGALDQLRMGVILTDGLGTPLFVNRAAELMMGLDRGISVSHGRLVLSTQKETALLHRLLADAAHRINGAATGGDMRITLPSRVEFLHCLVASIPPEISERRGISVGSGCAAVFISRPGSMQLPPERLAVLYGLSPAESRLVAKLAALISLDQAANELGIALGTARTQLAAVFAKTRAKGQAELLMLLATGTLAQCRDGIADGGSE